MIKSSVVTGYAQALYDLAKNEGVVEQIEQELVSIDQLLKECSELRKLMFHPGVGLKDKKKLAGEVFVKDGMPLIKKFLFVLIEKRREKFLEYILESYKSVVRKAKGIVLAEIQSVKELTEENIAALKTKLEDLIKKEVEIKTSVNAKILGGIIIRFGDKLIDGSVRNRLYKLKRKLMQANPA